MNKFRLIFPLFILFAGLAGGYWLGQNNTQQQPASHTQENKKKVLFYRNPMDPSITSPIPAQDHMGMDYIAVYEELANAEQTPAGTVTIDGTVIQNIGVRTTTAISSSIAHTIRTVGRVDYDEERIIRLHPKIEGWVEHMTVDITGQRVKKNTELLSIYSPQLVSGQQEYILAINNLKVLEQSPFADIKEGAEQLVRSARARLKLLDVPEHQLHDLEEKQIIKKSLHIHTPSSGIIVKIGAREGQFVTPATEIYVIADLTQVWVYADIYENELPWVHEGDEVEMTLAGIPGKTFTGSLAYIYPYAESKTRTIKVRMVFDNPDLLLKPDMFAQINIEARKLNNVVVIPSEAVIRTGNRDKVFVVRGQGKFEPRNVTLGLESDSKISVMEGLEHGEIVVTSAQFLLDSESKLREATAKMIEPGNKASP